MFWQAINSGDFWHHLNTGKYIFENFALPYKDNLSFTASGLPWVAHSWGAGVIFYLFYSQFGETGISFLFLLLGLLTTYLIYLTCQPISIPVIPAKAGIHQSKSTIYNPQTTKLLLALLGGSLISLRWPTRPEVFAALFCSLLIVLLQRKKYFFLPLLFWVWGIIYGSSVFIGFIIYLLYIFINEYMSFRAAKRDPESIKINSIFSGPRIKSCLAARRAGVTTMHLKIVTASIITSLLNGYGLSSFFYLKQIPAIAPHVGEWLSVFAALNPNNPSVALFYQFPILFLIILITTLLLSLCLVMPDLIRHPEKFKPNFYFYFLLSTFIFTPFISIRFINLYPVFVLPLLAKNLEQIPKATKKYFYIALTILTFSTTVVSFLHKQQNFFPSKAIEYLKANNLNGNILSSQENGAYISYHLPNSKIFVDTRDDLYQPTEVFTDLAKLNINQLVNKYPIDIIIADLSEYYHPLLYNPKWHLVFLSDQYFVLTKLAVKSELKFVDPLQVPPAKGKYFQEALMETPPNSPENLVRQIQLLLALNKPSEAVNLLPKLQLQNRLEDNELQNMIYLLAGDCEKTDVYFKKSLKQSKHQFIFTPWVNLPTIARSCP